MTEWNTLRARFPDDEFDEIERIKEKYGLGPIVWKRQNKTIGTKNIFVFVLLFL